MAKLPNSSHPILGWATGVLFFLGVWIFTILRDDLLKHWLEECCPGMLAALIKALAQISLPLFLAGLIVWALYRYLQKRFDAALKEIITPRLRFGAIRNATDFGMNGPIPITYDQVHLTIENVGKGIIRDCLVVVDRMELSNGATVALNAAIGTVNRWRENKIGRFNLDHGIPKQILLTCRELNPQQSNPHQLMAENRYYPLLPGSSGAIYLTAAAPDAGDPRRLKLNFSVDEKERITVTQAD